MLAEPGEPASEAAAALTALVHRVELSRDGLRLSLKVPMPATPGAANDRCGLT
jgi:hypothetical protein